MIVQGRYIPSGYTLHTYQAETGAAVYYSEWAAKRREASNRPNLYRVGQIFSYSWGYDQTNVDFFQVVAIKPKSVVVREIASEMIPSDSDDSPNPMAGYCRAVPDAFLDRSEEIVKRVFWNTHGDEPTPYITFDHGTGRLYEPGSKKYVSLYA